MPKPTQASMFTTQDLPLFSSTAPRATDSVFVEQEPEPKQLSLPAPDTCITWTCPQCGTENEDYPELTVFPMCSGCEDCFNWQDITPTPKG